MVNGETIVAFIIIGMVSAAFAFLICCMFRICYLEYKRTVYEVHPHTIV